LEEVTTQVTWIEAIAALFGLPGTLLLATRGRWAGYGFLAFLFSNIGWLSFSWDRSHYFMFAQQVAFTVTSVMGLWTWVLSGLVDRCSMTCSSSSAETAHEARHRSRVLCTRDAGRA